MDIARLILRGIAALMICFWTLVIMYRGITGGDITIPDDFFPILGMLVLVALFGWFVVVLYTATSKDKD